MPEGPFPEHAFETVGPERVPTLRAMVRAAQESPFGWRHYPYSPTDYLTDLWRLALADGLAQSDGVVLVDEGWWNPNVNNGRVHLHPERPNGGWSVASHRPCEPVYTRRVVPPAAARG